MHQQHIVGNSGTFSLLLLKHNKCKLSEPQQSLCVYEMNRAKKDLMK